MKHKAAKGELRQGLPVGLDYDEDDRVMITPDEAVREAIATVFRRFDELGSARQVLIRLREHGVLLPRRRNGSPRITWAPATYPAVHDLLTNPAYAGAFVFGRTRTEKRIDPVTGAVHSRDRLMPREQWQVLIPDHHPGFITWETYEANTARLRGNWRRPRELPGGAVREGRALLQGLLRCGRCSRPAVRSGTPALGILVPRRLGTAVRLRLLAVPPRRVAHTGPRKARTPKTGAQRYGTVTAGRTSSMSIHTRVGPGTDHPASRGVTRRRVAICNPPNDRYSSRVWVARAQRPTARAV